MAQRFVPGIRLAPLVVLCGYLLPSITSAYNPSEAPRSTLRTYTPAPAAPSPTDCPSPFHCDHCWSLRQGDQAPLSQHQAPRFKRSHHERGPRPHKNPFAKTSRGHGGLRSLPRQFLSIGGFARSVESWQVRTVDGDTIRYGTDRIRIRGYNAPELSEPGGREAALRLGQLMQQGAIDIVPHGHDVYGRTLADVYVNGQNVADVMMGEGFGRRG